MSKEIFPWCYLSMRKILSKYFNILVIPPELLCSTQRQLCWWFFQHPMASSHLPHSSQCFVPVSCSNTLVFGKVKKSQQMVGTELVGPFMLSPLLLVGRQHKLVCPHDVSATMRTWSCRHQGGVSVLCWHWCSSWLVGGLYIRLYTLRPQARKAFKHLLTPKLLSNSSGVS